MRILYAEDEHALSEAVSDILTYHKYAVDTVDNGTDALDYALAQRYDAIILDIMMPGRDGLSVVRELRERGVSTPTLLLTAKGELEDRIDGLDAGADDYLPKPFAMSELLARVRALLRRSEAFSERAVIESNVQKSCCLVGHDESLRQMMDALLDNACCYASENTPVKLRIRQSARQMEMEISNCVDALPACEPDKLFERFCRADRVLSDSGCGVGLSAAKAVVQLHRGVIRIRYPDEHTFLVAVQLPSHPAKRFLREKK